MSRGMQCTGSVAAVSISVFTCENAASILFNVYWVTRLPTWPRRLAWRPANKYGTESKTINLHALKATIIHLTLPSLSRSPIVT